MGVCVCVLKRCIFTGNFATFLVKIHDVEFLFLSLEYICKSTAVVKASDLFATMAFFLCSK